MANLNEILGLPGNRRIFNSLAKLLREQKAIAFVGAGTSAGMYPLWGKFIELLADHAVAEGKAEAKDAARWKADRTSTPQQRVNVILRKSTTSGSTTGSSKIPSARVLVPTASITRPRTPRSCSSPSAATSPQTMIPR